MTNHSFFSADKRRNVETKKKNKDKDKRQQSLKGHLKLREIIIAKQSNLIMELFDATIVFFFFHRIFRCDYSIILVTIRESNLDFDISQQEFHSAVILSASDRESKNNSDRESDVFFRWEIDFDFFFSCVSNKISIDIFKIDSRSIPSHRNTYFFNRKRETKD